MPGGSRSGVVGRCVGDVSCCRRGTCRCVPPLIAPRVVACDRVCWGLVVRWTARRTPSSLAASRGRNPDTSAAPLAVPRGSLLGGLSWLGRRLSWGLCAPRIPIVSIAVFVGAVERLLDRRARLVAPSRAARANASPLTRTQVRWSARGSANSHAGGPAHTPNSRLTCTHAAPQASRAASHQTQGTRAARA